MRRITISLLLFAGISWSANAQKDLTIDEIFRKPELNPVTLKQLKWAGSSSRVCWVAKEKLILHSIGKSQAGAQAFKPDTVLTVAELNKDLKRFPAITWLDEERFTYSFKGNQIIFNLKTKQEVSRLIYGEDAESRKSIIYLFKQDQQFETSATNRTKMWFMVNRFTATNSAFPRVHSGVRWVENSLFIGWIKAW
jgi:hypothetical protein